MTAPSAPNFSISATEGVDFTQTYTVSSSTPELPGPPFSVGQHVLGTNGTEYMFVKASTAIAQWQAVSIDTTEAAAVPLTIALANAGAEIGWAQVAIAAAAYGWVAIRGQQIGVLAKRASLAGVKLYVSSTSPGTLTSTSVRTSALVQGVTLTTSCTSAMLTTVNSVSGPVVATATWPRGIG